MLKCPTCNHRTISRWRAQTICSYCKSVVCDVLLYRVICVPVPMTCAAFMMSRWYPDAGSYWFVIVLVATGIVGLAINYAFPRFDVVGAAPIVLHSDKKS